MKNIANSILCGLILCITGCGDTTPVTKRYTHVEKVYCHGTSFGKYRYGILAFDPETKELISQEWLAPYSYFKIFADVPAGGSMWAEETKTETRVSGDTCYSVEIHIHSTNEIIDR